MAERNKGKGLRRSPQQWQTLLAKCADGMSVESFCRREAISTASFYRWRCRLGSAVTDAQRAGSDSAVAFVDLGILKPSPSSSFISSRDWVGEAALSIPRSTTALSLPARCASVTALPKRQRQR